VSPSHVVKCQVVDWFARLKERILPAASAAASSESPLAAESLTPGPKNEQRRAARLRPHVPLQGMCVVSRDRAFTVTITDLALTGMKLESPSPLPLGQSVKLSLPVNLVLTQRKSQEFVKFHVTVQWCHKKARQTLYQAGVRYDEPYNRSRDRWVTLVLETYGFRIGKRGRRQEARWETCLNMAVTGSGQHVRHGEVLNICMGGMLGRIHGDPLAVGERVYVQFGPPAAESLAIGGTVLRSHAIGPETSTVGLSFDPLPTDKRDGLVECLVTLGKGTERAYGT